MTHPAASGDTGRQPRAARRAHQQSALDIGAPMTASFVGLLLLGKPEHLLSAEGETDTALPAGAVPTDGGETAGQTADTGPQALPTNTPVLVSGTFFSAGEVIDVAALTRLSGGVRLGGVEGSNDGVLATAQAASAGAEPDAVLPEGDVELAAPGLAGDPEAEAPPVDIAPDEEGLGDVGEAVVGTDGDDTIVGGDANDALAGGGGDDAIYGAGGDDAIEGNTGDDRLYGGGGDDRLDGGTGDDLLDGGEGDDRLDGGAGNDELIGGTGLDELRGGLGDDVLQIDHVADFALEDRGVGGGDDILAVEDGYASSLKSTFPWLSSDGSATFVLGDDLTRGVPEGANGYVQRVPDAIESVALKGTTAHDLVGDGRDNRLFGNAGDNLIHGGDGADTLAGDGGDDFLYGDGGDDTLLTGDGTDTLYGGAGDDLYLLGLAEGPADTIFDHEGANHLRVDGTGGVGARLDGDSLIVSRGGADVARIDGYVGHETAFQTIEFGGESHELAGLLPAKPMSVAADDMLAGFMDDPGTPAVAPSFGLAEPAAAFAPESDELPVFFDDPGHHSADLTGLGGIETLTAQDPLPGAARGLERLAFSREGG